MNRWQLLLDLLKDAATWMTGLGVIIWQASRPVPSELMVGAGLVLTNVGVYRHIRAVLPGGSASSSSGPAGPEAPSESPSSSREGDGDGGG